VPPALLYLAGALLLHAALALLVWGPRARHAPAPLRRGETELGLVPVALEPPKPRSSAPPGGGAPKPAATSRPASAPRTVSHGSVAVPTPTPAPTQAEPPPESPAVLAAPEAEELAEPLADLVSQASNHVAKVGATRVASEQSALGPFAGSGPGSRGGPGGPGSGFGNGRLAKAFAFGGPSGAFRAEVCFIPASTRSLRQIRGCKTEATFFTDHLDVPPRSFTDGFPGITSRTEWFAIYYHGRFRVQVADYFTFKLISDDGSLLYVDGHLIIDNDGGHPPASKLATVPLAAGEHLLNVEYYQGPRDRIALQLFVIGSDGKEKLFGPLM